MSNPLADFLLKYVNFTNDELDIICEKFYQQTIEKKQFFLREGEVCNKLALIINGKLILSQTSALGDEKILDFFTDGELISDFFSLLKNLPSDNDIKALKKSDLYVLSNKDKEYLFETMPNFQILGRKLAEEAFIRLAITIKQQSLSPAKRYQFLIADNRKIVQEFPQYMIASYLGITPEWLSKIRSQK